MAIVPVPGTCANCGGGGGSGSDSVDVEQTVLCDTLADGEVVGAAIAVYEYDADGNPVGAPTFVDPATGNPYVPQGTLMVCPGEVGCGAPQQFCFTSSATNDVPGRMYDLTFSLGQGFAVTGVGKDLTFAPTNVLWSVNDADASDFITDLTAAVQSQFPGATVNIAPGTDNRCIDGTQEFSIHIECLRLDQDPPTLVQLRYNGGRDLVLNPAYNETPPLNPPVSQGNYGYHLLARQDDPGPFPGNQPAGRADCTNVANRGWETNDVGRTFEIWGQDVAGGVTPTPRGTPVQEVTSDGPPPGQRSTIWQTFVVPAAGNFNIRLVHGARDAGEQHIISLSTGDTDANQVGDIILDTTNPPAVYGGNPWTIFNQVVALTPGVYTLAISSTNPVGGARGGLFTDMRAFVDGPEVTDSFVNNDDTCTVSVTSDNTTCEFWAPRCTNGTITAWYNIADGEELTNAAFWAQVPAPTCCTSTGGDTGGNAALGNLVHTYLVCGQTDTGPRTLSRVVYTDQSGAAVLEQFVDTSGALVTPSSWQPGECAGLSDPCNQVLGEICFPNNGDSNNITRAVVTRNCATGAVVYRRISDGADVTQTVADFGIATCPSQFHEQEILCDAGNGNQQFIRGYTVSANGVGTDFDDFELDGATPYAFVGPAVLCSAACGDTELLPACDNQGLGLTVQFYRRTTYNCDGTVASTSNVLADGTPYVPVGTIQDGECAHQAVNPLNWDTAVDGAWTPAAIPLNSVLLGLSATVIVADPANVITDSSGHSVTDLPVSYTASWAADQVPGFLSPPLNIDGGAGRILITFSVAV